MKMFKAMDSGCSRSAKAWKGAVIVWFCWLIMVCLVAFPLKAALKSGLGSSTIAERLLNGIDVEVLGDLGNVFKSILRSLFSGLFFILIAGILLNSFLSGGLFNSLKSPLSRFSSSDFFRAGAKNFWAFLLITFLIGLILAGTGSVIVGIPAGIASRSGSHSESTPYVTAIIASIVYGLISVIFILVADYARAWYVRAEKPAVFQAIGFGFGRVFERFRSSYPMMLILLIVQAGFSFLVIRFVSRWRPVTGGGVFLMFIVSQLLFIISLLVKLWRYASVTALMELNDKAPQTTDKPGEENLNQQKNA